MTDQPNRNRPRSPREHLERLMSEGHYEEADDYIRTLEMFHKLDGNAVRSSAFLGHDEPEELA